MRASGTTVVRLITRLNIGGPARQALLLTRELAPDYRTILAAGFPTPEEGELSDPRVEVVRVPLVRPLSPPNDVRAVRAVRALLRRHRAGLVHTHMAKAGTVGRLAASTVRPRPRTVHTFHGHVLEGYFGSAAQRTFLTIERALARRTDVLVAVSPQIRDQLLDLGIGRPGQYEVIPLGLELDRHRTVEEPSGVLRERLGLGPDVPLVGIVGRLVPIKDHETIFSAMRSVPGAHLAVLGDGELRDSLEKRAVELGLDDRVHFTGWWHDVPSAMADLDVVALSSRNEGTPVSLIEAAACGRAVAAVDVGGVVSVVEHEVTGLISAPGDAEGLAASLRRLLGDPALRARMGEAGRRASGRFDAGTLVDRIRDLYDGLLSDGPARRGRRPRGGTR